ncbi:MAG: hypothetical protein K1X88_18710 [Nannocystaceae bacterium]|nr:hypothetical protein [Nannocystaceae bacterium]
MDALQRLLELVARELEADDVRLELTLRAPAPEAIWVELAGGFRLHAIFGIPPIDADARREKLVALAQTFSTTFDAALARAPAPMTGTELAAHALDETLTQVVDRAAAIAAVVIDDASPMIWGSSLQPRGAEDVDVASWVTAAAQAAAKHGRELAALVVASASELDAALADVAAEDRNRIVRAASRLAQSGPVRTLAQWRQMIATMRAIAAARRAGGDAKQSATGAEPWGFISRGFGGIYRVVLACDVGTSELHAEATLLRALPVIEKQVAMLPPIQPGGGPGGGGGRGQVVRLRPP